MDVRDYRRAYEAELAAAADDASRTPHTFGLAPANAVTARRMTEIGSLPLTSENFDQDVPRLLQVLSSVGEALPVRLVALQSLRAAMVVGEQFAPYRVAFLQALRQLARPDVDAPLREEATSVLAAEKDPSIQDALKTELSNQSPTLVPLVKALQLLSLDDHSNVADLARDLFHRATDLAVKEAALRILAADAGSRDLFTSLLEDKSQPKSLRALSATGLSILDPHKFADVAQKIVEDQGDFEDIRATALGALANVPHQQVIRDNTDFLDVVRNLTGQTPLSNLREAAGRFLAKP
jgi:hypothetical protein